MASAQCFEIFTSVKFSTGSPLWCFVEDLKFLHQSNFQHRVFSWTLDLKSTGCHWIPLFKPTGCRWNLSSFSFRMPKPAKQYLDKYMEKFNQGFGLKIV